MKCPQCNGDCWRDEVDIGVGTMYGHWQCPDCGWYETHEVDAMIQADIENEMNRPYLDQEGEEVKS